MKRKSLEILAIVMALVIVFAATPTLASNTVAVKSDEQDQIQEGIRVNLPNHYDAVIGDTLQLFYRGIVEAVNPYQYNIQVVYSGTCTNAYAYPRYFSFIPSESDIGTHTLTINIRDNSDVILGTASTDIIVKPVVSSPASQINILCIGDDLTANGIWVNEVSRMLTETEGDPSGLGLNNINFIGTVLTGDTAHEGYDSWSWNSYLVDSTSGISNPFWYDDSINFQSYCSDHGYSGIDYVYFLLSWNGIESYRSTVTENASTVELAKTLIDKLHIQYPNAKIKVVGLQLPSLNGGIGYDGVYSSTYGLSRTVFGLNLAYQEWCNEEEYSGFLEFVNLSGQFDSENNMPEVLTAVNTRSTKTELRGTSGICPGNEGYYQISDAVFRNIVSEIAN